MYEDVGARVHASVCARARARACVCVCVCVSVLLTFLKNTEKKVLKRNNVIFI